MIPPTNAQGGPEQQQWEQLKQLLATVVQNKQLMALISAEWQKMQQQPQGIGHPDQYTLPIPNQGGTRPVTPHPLEQVGQMQQGDVVGVGPNQRPFHPSDSGMADAYDEILQRELLRKKIPGHLYGGAYADSYSEPPGSPLAGPLWYPGSSDDADDDDMGPPGKSVKTQTIKKK